MKTIISNSGYFLREVITMIRVNLASNILTFFSTGLIFFMLAMIISGWWVSNHVVNVVQGEAEISVYLDEKTVNTNSAVLQMVESIHEIEGARTAQVVDKEEAYHRMEEILGKEASVLTKFNDNPFNAYVEVKINLDQIEPVLEKLNHMEGVEYVRDNKAVLDRLRGIAGVLRLVGFLVVVAVGISTLVIISHIIKLGISNNKEKINTLRLLGAPESFIALPFLFEGLFLTLVGGILAVVLAAFSIEYLYAQMAGPLPFLPLPPKEILVSRMAIVVLSISALLGIIGSLLGLAAVKNT